MLDFSDLPYEFFPPRYFPPTAWALRQFNRAHRLPRALRFRGVEVRHAERLDAARGPKDRLLLTPNHPTHADAAIFIEACRQVGLTPRTMAAYDVFLRSRGSRWVMQRLGCFSVDRDGADKAALDEAQRTLTHTRHPLTVFPEGNVYLTNDRVTPLNDGASMIAVKAAKALKGDGGRVLVVPVAIKATHVDDARPAHEAVLRRTCEALGVDWPSGESARAALRRAAVVALRRSLANRGVEVPEVGEHHAGDVADVPATAADAVLRPLESKLSLTPRGTDTVIDRVRACRRVIHAVRIDPERVADHAAATGWANEAILAYRVASYAGDYVAERPTLDRIAETIEKLDEDVFDRMPEPVADRTAVVSFGEPIDVTQRLAAAKQRVVVQGVTRDTEAAIQAELDAINADNPHPGSELWDG